MTSRATYGLLATIALASTASCGAVTDVLRMALQRVQNQTAKLQEDAALARLNTINTTQVHYFSMYGRFARTLHELGPPAGGGPSGPDAAGLIDEKSAAGDGTGYRFRMVGTSTGYALNADPDPGSPARRHFFTSEEFVIRESVGRPASKSDPEIGSGP